MLEKKLDLIKIIFVYTYIYLYGYIYGFISALLLKYLPKEFIDKLSSEQKTSFDALVQEKDDAKFYYRYKDDNLFLLAPQFDAKTRLLDTNTTHRLKVDVKATKFFSQCKLCKLDFSNMTWTEISVHLGNLYSKCYDMDLKRTRHLCIFKECSKFFGLSATFNHFEKGHKGAAPFMNDENLVDYNSMVLEVKRIPNLKKLYGSLSLLRRNIKNTGDCLAEEESSLCFACFLPTSTVFHNVNSKDGKDVVECKYGRFILVV
jgi:hypothetical protein